MSGITQKQMPSYTCHKKVWALKISKIEYNNRESVRGAIITPSEQGYAPFNVTQEYLVKHHPEAGGYYVVYGDGYKSFSPAEAFESGYTKD